MLLNPNFRPVLTLSLAIAVTSCSGLSEEQTQQASRIEQLGTNMDQCLMNQDESQQQLTQQSVQLGELQASLSTLTALTAVKQQEASQRQPPLPLLALPAPACPPLDDKAAHSKMVIGQREMVWIQDLQLALPARIDTGAETASLDARNIELFERNSKDWVRFEIIHPQTGEAVPLERKLKRMVSIIQANNEESERRPVIKLGISIGELSQSAEFTLNNRSHLDYQISVGRNILKDVMIVDVSGENLAPHTQEPEADTAEGTELP
ncbi:MAG: RimK/LysX family protein [Halioglobus sp.]